MTKSKRNPTMQEKRDRCDRCNDLLRVIGSCGRRFFYQPRSRQPQPWHGNHSDVVSPSWAHLEVGAQGHVFFVDDWTRQQIYTHYEGSWRCFSHGGTARSLIIGMREYICGDRQYLTGHLGPWHESLCQGDLWGYGKDMQLVRDAAIALNLLPNMFPYCKETPDLAIAPAQRNE